VRLVGLDVGGTKVSAATLGDGVLSEPQVTPTDKSSSDALVDQLAGAAQAAIGDGADAVGIGIPSAIEWATGTAKSGVNVPLQGVPLRDILRDRLRLPVFVDNDANVAALAEAHDDRGQLVTRELVMFTIGTGVGGGLVLGGRLYRGLTGAGAELGHILIGVDLAGGAPPAADHFPQPGSLEALAAGTALDGLAAASAAEHPDSALGRVAASGEPLGGRAVVAAAQEGDSEAVRLLRVLGERLGIGIASALNLFDPEEVVVGGGAAAGAGELILGPARTVARAYALPGCGEQTEIRLARYGNDAGVRGAAMMAGQELAHENASEVVTQ
jgi:glucokinase